MKFEALGTVEAKSGVIPTLEAGVSQLYGAIIHLVHSKINSQEDIMVFIFNVILSLIFCKTRLFY